jgi:hypothetical protein
MSRIRVAVGDHCHGCQWVGNETRSDGAVNTDEAAGKVIHSARRSQLGEKERGSEGRGTAPPTAAATHFARRSSPPTVSGGVWQLGPPEHYMIQRVVAGARLVNEATLHCYYYKPPNPRG